MSYTFQKHEGMRGYGEAMQCNWITNSHEVSVMVRQARLWMCIAAVFLFCGGVTTHAKPLIKSGDRVVFLGGTFIERMQNYGHVEAEISCRVSGVTYRNLGWSGDNVWGESRAVFGTVAQGFERLQRDMTLAQPSVIIVSYGANEAHEGAAGLDRFVAGYQTLLQALKLHETTIVLITPRYYENLGPPLPDPQSYNTKLKIYIEAIDALQLAVKKAYELTAEKNMMFFHRHRPQNETYLFLFRKHEQGNNAVEVPQYDPIVDGFEKRIQEIQNSSSYKVEIRRG
jgi:lysophospholipase L1-like esterase